MFHTVDLLLEDIQFDKAINPVKMVGLPSQPNEPVAAVSPIAI